MELKSALENAEQVTVAVLRDDSVASLVAPAATDTAAAFVYLKDALDCANADEDANLGIEHRMNPAEWERIARFLWELLDNIDTLDDSCKADDGRFRERARRQQKMRWTVSASDGHGRRGRCHR